MQNTRQRGRQPGPLSEDEKERLHATVAAKHAQLVAQYPDTVPAHTIRQALGIGSSQFYAVVRALQIKPVVKTTRLALYTRADADRMVKAWHPTTRDDEATEAPREHRRQS